MVELNETHDGRQGSWVASANEPQSDFPLQNLPFGVFSRAGESPRGGVAIGDQLFDLRAALDVGVVPESTRLAAEAAAGPALNPLLTLGAEPASLLRAALFGMLRADGPEARRAHARADKLLVPMGEAQMHLPAQIGAYTDFCCSFDHIRRMAGGTPPPAFFHVPIGYNGRASSIAVSGSPVRRPRGQYKDSDGTVRFGPEPMLDFELEFGAYVGTANPLGDSVDVGVARSHLFGYCLVNDWSARGIQFFESILGPFLGKSFLTSVSPWIVTAEALAPFRVPARGRAAGEPPVPSHLLDPQDRIEGGLDVELTASIRTCETPYGDPGAAQRIVTTNFRQIYWTPAQMLAHHTSNGCNLLVGDLLASGTVSGPEEHARSCLAEITQMGAAPLRLEHGVSRQWLQDGDEIILRGRATRPGLTSIGFGDCTGRIVAH